MLILLPGPVRGIYFYLYLILDIYSRDIVGWEVWTLESAEHASQLIRRAVMAQSITRQDVPLVLHSDNGSPMKGAAMLETLYQLGITPSRSRPGLAMTILIRSPFSAPANTVQVIQSGDSRRLMMPEHGSKSLSIGTTSTITIAVSNS